MTGPARRGSCYGRRFDPRSLAAGQIPTCPGSPGAGCRCGDYLVATARFFDAQGNEIRLAPVTVGSATGIAGARSDRTVTKWTARRVYPLGHETPVDGFPAADSFCEALQLLVRWRKK